MIFLDWQIAGLVTIALLMVAAGVWGLTSATKLSAWFLRLAARIASVGLALFGSLSLLLMWAGSGCTSHSVPIYSPSGRMAARIENADEGALGGSTSVALYWAHGLRHKTVFQGEWATVEPVDIHWSGDSRLTIQIRDANSDYASQCASAGGVKVECSPRPLR